MVNDNFDFDIKSNNDFCCYLPYRYSVSAFTVCSIGRVVRVSPSKRLTRVRFLFGLYPDFFSVQFSAVFFYLILTFNVTQIIIYNHISHICLHIKQEKASAVYIKRDNPHKTLLYKPDIFTLLAHVSSSIQVELISVS